MAAQHRLLALRTDQIRRPRRHRPQRKPNEPNSNLGHQNNHSSSHAERHSRHNQAIPPKKQPPQRFRLHPRALVQLSLPQHRRNLDVNDPSWLPSERRPGRLHKLQMIHSIDHFIIEGVITGALLIIINMLPKRKIIRKQYVRPETAN